MKAWLGLAGTLAIGAGLHLLNAPHGLVVTATLFFLNVTILCVLLTSGR